MNLANPMGLFREEPEIYGSVPSKFSSSKYPDRKLSKNQKKRLEIKQLVCGPLAMLTNSIKQNDRVRVYCRHNTVLLGTLAAFDRHLNLFLKNVTERWENPSKGIQKEEVYMPGNFSGWKMERFITQMLVRGDNIILISRDPTWPGQA